MDLKPGGEGEPLGGGVDRLWRLEGAGSFLRMLARTFLVCSPFLQQNAQLLRTKRPFLFRPMASYPGLHSSTYALTLKI